MLRTNSAVLLFTSALLLLSDAATAQQPPRSPDPELRGLQWRMVGPFRGGRSTAVAGVPDRPHVFFMGTTGGGVWKTEDAGMSWKNLSDGFFGGSVGAVAVAPSDANVIWVGTGSACIRGNTSTGRGVWRSTDGGGSWTFVGLPETGQVGDLLVHPGDPDVAFVAALGHPFGPNRERGIFRTRDGGRTWEHVLFLNDSTGVVDLAMQPDNPRILYAGAWRAQRLPWSLISGGPEGGVYKSVDGGDSWTKLGGGLPEGIVGKVGVTVSPADPNRVWAIIEAEPEGGVYRSDDAGKTWTRTNSENKLRQRAWYYTHIEADPQDASTVYALNTGFYRSTDGGKTFEQIPVPHGDVHDVWIHPHDPRVLATANDGGVQVSLTHGKTWSTYYNQPTAELYDVAIDHAFPYRLYGAQQDNTTIRVPAWTDANTIHPKEHWEFVGGCETGPIALHPDHPELVYAGCYGGVIDRYDFRTEDRRNVVIYPELQLGQAMKDLRERFQWVSPIVVSRHDPATVYHASQRVHRSRDGGSTWETISPDLSRNDPAHQERAGGPLNADVTGVEVFGVVFSLAESPHSPDVLWAGSDDGRVHVTRDGGRTWSDVTPSGMPALGTVDEIEASAHAPGRALMAVQKYRLDDFRPYIYATDDFGRSWRLLTDGRNGIPADHPVRTVREDPEVRGLLYAGTEFGAYVSLDDGRSWRPLQQNLPVTPVTGMQVAHGDLVVSTQGRSFWILDDLSPLRAMVRARASGSPHLFAPRPAYRTDTRGFEETGTEAPAARPGPALLYYSLPSQPASPVTLTIRDAGGRVMRVFTSDTTVLKAKGRERSRALARLGQAALPPNEPASQGLEGGPVGLRRVPVTALDTLPLPDSAGLHRVAWALTYPAPQKPDSVVAWGYTGGPLAPPGTYTARLTIGGTSQDVPLQILPDPRRTHVTQAEYEEQLRFALAVRDTLDAVFDATSTLYETRGQIRAAAARAVDGGYGEDLSALADSVNARVGEVLNELTQTRSKSGQDPIRFPGKLDNRYLTLYENAAGLDEYRFGGPDGPPTPGMRERFTDLNREWEALRRRLEAALAEVRAFNAELERRGVPAVVVPASEAPTISAR